MLNDIDRIRDALRFIPADDRDEWIKAAMAVKSKLGDAGYDLWDTWSQSAESYNASHAKAVWRSTKASGGIGIGTLFHMAQQNGWQGNGEKPDPATVEKRKREAEQRAAKEQVEQKHKRESAANNALTIWQTAQSASKDNPYLQRKQVAPVGTLRQIDADQAAEILGYTPKSSGEPLTGQLLVVPVKVNGQLSTVELIDGNGHKTALAGGAKSGGYWAAQQLPETVDTLLIGEGVATVLSAKEATGYSAVAALSCGNQGKVAETMRQRYPNATLVILADIGNGQPKAEDAARAVNGLLAVPEFGDTAPEGLSDFNDMAVMLGLDAVRDAIKRADSVYPKPEPLPELPPVPEFPLDVLPDDLAPWVADAAERARFRPDYAAVASMAALGSVIGRKIGIRLKQHDDWTEYANVWGGLIGPPSALKSPAMREAMRPFKALQVAADNQHSQAMDEHTARMEAHKLRKEARRKDAMKKLAKNADADIDLGDTNPPERPVARTYWTSDPTAERLGELLAENPTGLLVERDELSPLLVKLEDELSATARGLFLSGWSGKEGYRFDRIGRGTTTMPKFALSVIGGIQPGPLERYVRSAFSGERADGLLQRFQLIVWPDPAPFEYVDRYPDKSARERAAALFERADTLDADTIGERDEFGDNPPYVRLSPMAQALFVQWYSQFMQDRRSVDMGGEESAPLAAHFGKYPGLVGKLALIIHIADEPESKEVSEQTLLKALAWIDYLTPHARRVYHATEHPETGAAKLLLARLRRGDLPERFKAWEISRKQWHGLTDRDTVKKACRLLLEYGWLIEIDSGSGKSVGRPSDPIYSVSPAAEVML